MMASSHQFAKIVEGKLDKLLEAHPHFGSVEVTLKLNFAQGKMANYNIEVAHHESCKLGLDTSVKTSDTVQK